MKLKSIIVSIGLSFTASFGFAQDIPNTFTPSTPANAADVNENFVHVVDRLKRIENTSMGYLMRDGEIELNVDCTSDPAELNKVYADWWRLRELNFFITGDCYGDITIIREVDESGAWTGQIFQPMGQTINIRAAAGQVAGLIPNDLTQQVEMVSSFGGGLYLSNLNVTLGTSDFFAIIYSRNGHGGLNNITLNGRENGGGTGILVQEGAQVYVNGVTVSGVTIGASLNNGGKMRLFGSNSFSATGTALAVNASTIRQTNGSGLTLTGPNALALTNSSTLLDGTITVPTSEFSGDVRVDNESILSVASLTAPSSVLIIEQGTAELGSVDINNFRVLSGNVTISGGNVAAVSEVFYSAHAFLENTSFADYVVVDYGASASFAGGTLGALLVTNGSMGQLNGTSITNEAVVSNNATALMDNVTGGSNIFVTGSSHMQFRASVTSGNLDVRSNGRVDLSGTTHPITRIFCQGGQVDYPDASMLVDAPNSGCLDTGALVELHQLLLTNNEPD